MSAQLTLIKGVIHTMKRINLTALIIAALALITRLRN